MRGDFDEDELDEAFYPPHPELPPMTVTDVGRLIRVRQGDLSLRELARAWEIDVAHLSRLTRGQGKPGPRILKRLGLEAVVTYRYRRGTRRSVDR